MAEQHNLKYYLKARKGWVCIDEDVEEILRKSEKAKGEGIVNIFVKGSTGSVILIENDPNLIEDLFDTLEKIASFDKDYKHHLTWHDDNGASHVRASLLGQSISIPYKNGKLIKGTWQNIIIINHDTRDREREVIITLL